MGLIKSYTTKKISITHYPLINVCIHGHFYQPPRENPWTGEIEKQPGASPYHDWNEKIYQECYKPNAMALILNDKGVVLKSVNNYEYLNFNFGPTLLHWIYTKHPDTYKKIIEADMESVKAHHGHGNAIAMAYNHIIMPLANLQDKITQIRWGLKDFEYHFGRKAESIWLPETACNMDTIEVLIQENIRYIILDTSQAESIRKIENIEWMDESHGNLDPKIPYRCSSEKDPAKYINIFFYDGPISKAVAFDDVLGSSNSLLNKILHAAPQNIKDGVLINIATDGETFGHHKKSAERTLAYFVAVLADANKLNIVNYGEYLEQHPAEYEVKIKPGKNGEGTSWSCPHGVERWKDDCGCAGGGGWNQKWRKPLRESLDWLRDEMIKIYQNIGSQYLKDVWKARNEYIELILDNSHERRLKFFESNAVRILSNSEVDLCYRLLDMQKYSMFMFTSCGWFYSEISGIEAVQILQYAARAIELAEDVCRVKLEDEFVNRLSVAKSNINEFKDGRGVWEKLVKPAKLIANRD